MASTTLSTSQHSAAERGAALVVNPVATRHERRAFLELPWAIYRGNSAWMPPLRQNQKELAGFARHPFHAENQMQTFVAWRGGEPVGRIAAIVNQSHLRQHADERGFFGFFESIDDLAVARGLFDAAADWLRGRGMKRVRGPANPSLNYEVGLLVDGFDKPPSFMMTYNPPYYARLIEAYGFQKSQDMFAFFGTVDMLDRLDKKLAFVAEESQSRFAVSVRPMDRSRFVAEIEMFLNIYNQSLVGTWGFAPLSQGEVHHMAQSLKYLIIPELAIVAEAEGKPIGAVFCLPDYNPRIKASNGRLFPLGFLRLLSPWPRFRRLRVISANVLPEYQRWGVGLVLVKALIPKFMESGMVEGEFSWVLESNHLSRKTLERGGALLEKTYRIYDRDLT